MEALFTAVPSKGRLIFDNLIDVESYCIEQDGVELVVSMKPAAKTSEKMRMYAYLFGPLMDCAVIGYTNAGWPGMDKVKARYKLQAEFAKAEMINPEGKIEIYLLDISKMSKARLLKFIQDIIFFLESELHQSAPDSSRYKMMQITGRNFSSVKFKDQA